MQLLPMASSPDGLISSRYAVIRKTIVGGGGKAGNRRWLGCYIGRTFCGLRECQTVWPRHRQSEGGASQLPFMRHEYLGGVERNRRLFAGDLQRIWHRLFCTIETDHAPNDCPRQRCT